MHQFIPDLKLITSLLANRMQSFGSQLCGFIKQILVKACRLIHNEHRQEGTKMPTQKKWVTNGLKWRSAKNIHGQNIMQCSRRCNIKSKLFLLEVLLSDGFVKLVLKRTLLQAWGAWWNTERKKKKLFWMIDNFLYKDIQQIQ